VSRPYRPHIDKSLGELLDTMTFMLLRSPKFRDQSGYFPEMNLDNSFYGLNESLRRLQPQPQLGDELYAKLAGMSDQMRAYFEADPDQTTGETRKGKDLVYDMEELIKARAAELKAAGQLWQPESSYEGK
jgi:hypothetical protein